MPQLACKNLAIGYDGKIVQQNISFSIDKGDYLCIVGENGAGKSTLMKTLLGLEQPISGTITYANTDMTTIGYLPQQTDVQRDFPASVSEVVLSGCLGNKDGKAFYTKEDRASAQEAMKRVDILPLAKRCYRELSGGQQQRVLLSRALCATQNILLLDEPVTGLDPRVTADMYELIQSLNDTGITIIMISHDLAMALGYATKVLHIGAELFFGTTAEYLHSKQGQSFSQNYGTPTALTMSVPEKKREPKAKKSGRRHAGKERAHA